MTLKFQKGHRVTILSRRLRLNNPNAHENSGVGEEAIVMYNRGLCYSLLVFRQNDPNYAEVLKWYEETDLELVCSNTEKGVRLMSDLQVA